MKHRSAGIAFLILFFGANAHSALPPGIMFSTLLKNLTIQRKTGEVRLGNQVQAVFVQPGQKGWTILRTAEGRDLYKVEWDAELIQEPYCRINDYRSTEIASGKSAVPMIVPPGDYAVDYYLEGGKFYSYPFTVVKREPSDPFAGGSVYQLEGAWRDWGYLLYPDLNADQNLLWKVFLCHADPDKWEKEYKISVAVVRDKDKKLVCTNREEVNYTLNQGWIRYDFDMVYPPQSKTTYGSYFKARDLLAVDGDYTLTMKLNGSEYGVWKFKIVNGKPNYTGRTERGKADQFTFIEGGRDAFWYERVKK